MKNFQTGKSKARQFQFGDEFTTLGLSTVCVFPMHNPLALAGTGRVGRLGVHAGKPASLLGSAMIFECLP